jgi:DNA polymerase-3 subunit alpha
VGAHFTHLHLHTTYSLLDGAIQHTPLFEQLKSLGMSAAAMTDHGNMFGAVEFYEKARAAGIQPILGCEVYVAAHSRFEREKRERDADGYDAISHLLLLAMDATGYKNLIYLVSKAYLEGFYYKPRIDLDLLRERSSGLIATSGCLSSMVSRAIVGGEMNRAWGLVEEFSRIFPDRFYLELQRHGISNQDLVNAELVKISADLGLPLVATNDAHYLHHDDDGPHEALLCIGTGKSLADPHRFRFDGRGFYVKSADEMAELFHDHPSAVSNTMEITERCRFDLEMGEYHLPEFQVPADTTREAVLEAQSLEGLRRRLGLEPDEPFGADHKRYVERMEHELGVIRKMGFPGYFLIVADFIDYARRAGIPVGPGRGSSAGSLVAYSLGITGVDPVEYDIIFERFLNPERISMPDIDVDFCMRGRDQVIRYVQEKYDGDGDDEKRVAQIITFGTLQARAAIRDCGRVMGMPYGEVDRIAKLIPETLGITLRDALDQSADLRARIEADGQVRQLVETAIRLEGLTRHASTHAAGVVIGDQPLIDLVPLYRDPRSGDVMTQFDWRVVERIGLIKFDFLGLKTLTLIADTERRIRARSGSEFAIDAIPLEDSATRDLLTRGDTEGVFQLESSGITELVVKLKPQNFKEVIPLIALYRPGPLGSGMVDDYVSRKHGLTKVEYLLPELEELTAETLGVIVYQDQVLQIANRLAGYSLGEADLLRRAMGKKNPAEMEKQRERFMSGCRENGIDDAKAQEVFRLMAEFAGYGFPKAHSAAYALITYQTAYLKANYPREFLASLLSIEAGNHDKLARYIAHAREGGLDVLAPDVNESEREFTVVEEGIRFGLSGVKNVGEGAIDSILAAREATGDFESIFDFTSRIDGRRVNRRVAESLVKCGAFDSLHPNRAALWASLDAALERGAAAQRDREIGQASLFGGDGAAAESPPALTDAAEWTDRERLANEREVLGFYVTGHPLDSWASTLRRFSDVSAGEVQGKDGLDVRAGGILTALRETRTRRGDLMAFGSLEDLEGNFDLVIFAQTYGQYTGLLKRAVAGDATEPLPLLVTGTLEEGDSPKILVREVLELGRAEEKLASHLRLRVVESDLSRDRLDALRGVLASHRGDCAIYMHVTLPGESETVIAVAEPRGVRASDELLHEISTLFGRPVGEFSL